ncbi:FMN-binding protein [Isoptericola jiangsuensis]|uniref:FMN-binding protein n=1 Tax=Isoptericola jiangsuensis TaxID=548579 RepID=A0A2A9ET31_9MICO|nr:FMN-binding protein [Isoptericola jiangsuensis]PFG41691.1 FMN-binding protein [Isoptericola jiangsuensis]
MTARWRGTLVYVGSLVVIGTAAVTRYVGVEAPVASADATTPGTTAGTSGTTQDPTGSDGTSSGSSGSASGSTDGSSDGTGADTGSTPAPSDTGTAQDQAAQDVTVTGDVEQTRYGPVQVAVTFSGDQIVGVTTVQVPGGHRESVQINDRAAPILAQEVVDAQSARIDTVSGATYTTEGYRASVQSAIDAYQQG